METLIVYRKAGISQKKHKVEFNKIKGPEIAMRMCAKCNKFPSVYFSTQTCLEISE